MELLGILMGGAGILGVGVAVRGWMKRRKIQKMRTAANDARAEAAVAAHRHAVELMRSEEARTLIHDASAEEAAALINEVFGPGSDQ